MQTSKTRFTQRCGMVAVITVALAVGVGSLVWAGLIPGGGPTKSDCYVEANVQGIVSPGPDVRSNRIVQCVDGDPCDTDGACGNGSCRFQVAICVNQHDPNLPGCTPPASLRKLITGGPRGLRMWNLRRRDGPVEEERKEAGHGRAPGECHRGEGNEPREGPRQVRA